MAEADKVAGKSAGGKASPVSATDGLAGLLANANKIADRLQNAATQVDTNILMTDWLLLHTLIGEGPLSMSKAASKIGLTRQRVHQQASTLKAAGLLEIVETDAKTKTLAAAPGAKQLMNKLDRAFHEAISGANGEIPIGPINTAFTSTRRIVKAMPSKTSEKAE